MEIIWKNHQKIKSKWKFSFKELPSHFISFWQLICVWWYTYSIDITNFQNCSWCLTMVNGEHNWSQTFWVLWVHYVYKPKSLTLVINATCFWAQCLFCFCLFAHLFLSNVSLLSYMYHFSFPTHLTKQNCIHKNCRRNCLC